MTVATAIALRLIAALERLGCKVDVILPDGTHRYHSTHCRHGRCEDCSATEITGRLSAAPVTHVATIRRLPAQCKTCAAPCICVHHTS